MNQLEISLFGDFYISLDGRSLNGLVSDKARALLACLVTEADRPHKRSTLAAMLWPGKPEDISRANLRQTLHRLSQALGSPSIGPPYFLVTNEDIQFDLHSNCKVDVILFSGLLKIHKKCIQENQTIYDDGLKHLRAAVDLYHGDLLSGLSLPGCSEFQWWLTCRQEEYHHQVIELLMILVSHYEQKQDYLQSLQYIQQAIEFEPWNELFHRQKILYLARSGQRCAALRQYELCCKVLADELSVFPSIETILLYEQIRMGKTNVV